MPILNFVIDSVGQAGQVPKFVYFDTNDTLATVTAAGYLNHFVAQGNQLNVTSVAVVVSQESASVAPVANLYNIEFSSGNWILVEIGAGGGSGFNPALSYDGISNPAISGNWDHIGGFNVQAGTGSVTLQSDTGAVNILAPNSGQFVNITAANVAIQGTTATTITGASFTGTFTGNASLSATGPLSLSGSSVLVPGLANSAQSNVVQYNTTTGGFTYAPATGFNPATSETITGNWAFNGGFAATSASGNIPLVASSGNISLTASSGNITLNSPAVDLPALTNVVTSNVVYYNTSSGLLTYGAGGGSAFNPASNYTVTGTWDFTNASIEMPALASATTANVVYWNSSTGLLTQGAFTAFNPAANITFTGSDQFNGPFGVAASSGDVSIDSLAGSVNLIANTAGKDISLSSPSVVVTSSTAFNVSAGSSSYQTTGSGALSIGAGGILSLQGGGGINIPSITSGSATDVLYYNPGTGFVSAAAAPSAGMAWTNETTTPVSMAVSTGYITNDTSALLVYTLPVSAAVGQIVDVVGNSSGGWQINQNAGQNIQIGSVSSTAGTGGSVASGNRYDCVSLICTVANTTFVSKSLVGNVTIV